MKRFLRNNGLSLVLTVLFLLTIVGQSVSGWHKYNEDQREHDDPVAGYVDYLMTDDFLEATAENWESEFLQLFAYVLLTRFLYQRGSAESKDPEAPEAVPPPPAEGKVPGPVRRGGWVLKIYEHSLSITFLLLFVLSLTLHAIGGAGQFNDEQVDHGETRIVSAWSYLFTSTFWFESLQNWQSEFLALLAMVVLSIWLREKESPESKEVNAPHDRTGE